MTLCTAPTVSPLQLGDVHVWRVNLDVEARDLRFLLSSDEQVRAASYAFSDDRRRFVVARAALRRILAAYLHLSPREVSFEYGAAGKPTVRGVQFNASHCANLALVAVSTQPVGIDLEGVRPFPDALAVASSLFTKEASALLRATDARDRERVFFELWTQHEARVKATGRGLVGGQASPEEHTWPSVTWTPAEGFVASLVCETRSRLSVGEFDADVPPFGRLPASI
ncbi:4'-phosphopantetheinyl transferase family protein [Deinococcus yavapaiensis]|uniref:4'-phosphopantetheinyl transferase n=1 Tax=Deinococcus yavapaiensis KR-236 TaxID=694435 RepID=A0A318S9Z2_9DEIO|nr:4'-phosphopantetheinyl transferase superfamily protein [Deinococcus yavapaiensis]PYE55198.1 4'-phosphopantetheinyl transferase [Deinococcus yavapaiensis KR-236]